VYCLMTCLGEMATYLPVHGSFNHYATRFVDSSLGFALGWNYWLSVNCCKQKKKEKTKTFGVCKLL
ncbi:hypothetical protein BDF20DRAFT_858923, partial [Mycotypha africana]|uniref:uncharacterized protein n=1 Tax=Mycotypha africana TaxID=64632 RepID=UPI0023009047